MFHIDNFEIKFTLKLLKKYCKDFGDEDIGEVFCSATYGKDKGRTKKMKFFIGLSTNF